MFADLYRVWDTPTEANAYYGQKHLYTKHHVNSIFRIVKVELVHNKVSIFHCINKLGEPIHIAARAVGGLIEDRLAVHRRQIDKIQTQLDKYEEKVKIAIQNRELKQALRSNTTPVCD